MPPKYSRSYSKAKPPLSDEYTLKTDFSLVTGSKASQQKRGLNLRPTKGDPEKRRSRGNEL